MKVIYTGDQNEIERGEGLSRLSTALFGMTFPMSAEVDVSHLPDGQKRKLLNHPHFRAAGVDAAPVPLIIPASASVQAAQPEGEASGAERATSRKKVKA